MKEKSVYLCFAADLLHSGHMKLIERAAALGTLTIGILTDEAVSSYKYTPMVPYEERRAVMEKIAGVSRVIEQTTLSYRDVIPTLRPDIIVHGDDWKTGKQKPIRDEVVELLAEYGGELVEFPYAESKTIQKMEWREQKERALPDWRRGCLRRLIDMKGLVSVLEVHSGITGLIAEKTAVYEDGEIVQFDAMWVSSLTDSTAKGKPDIELVDFSSRLNTIHEILDVTTKPIILDGDTGGLMEHFVYTVSTLERIGISAIIIEDKTGLKKNSLFGNEVAQTQENVEEFCKKIAAGKRVQKTADFMIIARIESLILEKGLEDALARANAYLAAGADGIMIHSRKKEPDEVFAFIEAFRAKHPKDVLVVVPTSFNAVYEEEFKARGVNVVIYANHMLRSGYPAMQHAAEMILKNHRAKEADETYCMPIKDILTLIPDSLI